MSSFPELPFLIEDPSKLPEDALKALVIAHRVGIEGQFAFALTQMDPDAELFYVKIYLDSFVELVLTFNKDGQLTTSPIGHGNL